MSEPTTYALPNEPEGPVWDSNGDEWERTGEMLRAHGREWAEWQHVKSGRTGMWAAPLMRGPVTSTPPWKPEVGGTVETGEQYAAMPLGSVVVADGCHPSMVTGCDERREWETAHFVARSDRLMAGVRRTILRVGWSL